MMILKITLILQFLSVLESINTEENETSTPEQVVVRAVFINCEPNVSIINSCSMNPLLF